MKSKVPALSSHQFFVNRMIWYSIAFMAMIDAIWMLISGVTLNISKVLIFFPILGSFLGASLFYRLWRRDDCIYLFAQIASQLICAAATLGVFSYLTARFNIAFVDERLIAIDTLFFFDWRAYIAWADSIAWLSPISSFIYLSSGPQIMIVMALLFFYQHSKNMQKFLISFILTALITIVLAAIFPAVAGYVHYNIDIQQFQHLRPAAARIHEQDILDMRNHNVNVLMFPLKGIVTFPSFHSALAILLMYASLPIRWVRWVTIPLNIMVLFVTPIDGGHYLTDVFGGVIIALAAIYFTEWLYAKRDPLKNGVATIMAASP